ncbi:MAG: spore germination protein [Syntrophomonadaceae bacterium]|nr:spore germination protein [Syntrophomonadaceae bacterium]
MRRRFRISRNSKESGTPGEHLVHCSLEPDVFASGDISTSISDNEKRIREAFGDSSDLSVRRINFGAYSDVEVLVVHIDGLVDDQMVIQGILRPIGVLSDWPALDEPSPADIYNELKSRLIAKDELSEVGRMEDLLREICFGNSAIMVDGHNLALIADVKGWRQRNIESSTTEPTIRGSKEAFVETLRTNTSIIRRRIHDPRLRVEERTVGAIGRTFIAVVYIEGVAKDEVVQEVRDRIDRVSVDSIQGSGVLEEFIEDNPFSPFPTVLRTERVDRVVGALLEGRIAILTDGTPFTLIVPCNLFMFLSVPDDYFERFMIGSLLRLLRLFLFFIALLLPTFFVAAVTYHQEMIPTNLAISIAAQREGIPFPALVEAIILDVAFEILREATVRVPLVFGPAVSILGVLFLGQIAVQAGLVSPFMVITVSLTAIASLSCPIFSMGIAARMLRFVFLILGGTLGLYGAIWGFAALLIHLASLRSFGISYAEPLLPLVPAGLGDSVVRLPWWSRIKRPPFIAGPNQTGEASGQRPEPPKPDEDSGPKGGIPR